jgi:hypothetical protein
MAEQEQEQDEAARAARRAAHMRRYWIILGLLVLGALLAAGVFLFSGLGEVLGSRSRHLFVRAEVAATLAEFKVRQEQSMLESQHYRSSGPTNSEADLWPPEPSHDGEVVDARPFPKEWLELEVKALDDKLRCSYVAVQGEGGDNSKVGTIARSMFRFSAPKTAWFYLLAQCDVDQDPAVDSYFFVWSGDSGIYLANEGH